MSATIKHIGSPLGSRGGIRSVSGFGSGSTPDSTAYTNFIARTSGLDAGHLAAYKALLDGLTTDGLFNSDGTTNYFDALYMFATDTSANAIRSLVSATYDITLSGSPTFTADRGYTGNGSNMTLDTAFIPKTASSPKYTQTSAHLFGWSNTSAQDSGGLCGQFSADNIYIIPRYTDDGAYASLQSTAGVGPLSNTDGKGMYAADRNGTAQILYKNGSNAASNTDTSIAFVAASQLLGLKTGFGNSSSQIMAMGFGASLTSTLHGNLYSRVHTYLQTIAGVA